MTDDDEPIDALWEDVLPRPLPPPPVVKYRAPSKPENWIFANVTVPDLDWGTRRRGTLWPTRRIGPLDALIVVLTPRDFWRENQAIFRGAVPLAIRRVVPDYYNRVAPTIFDVGCDTVTMDEVVKDLRAIGFKQSADLIRFVQQSLPTFLPFHEVHS